jgi:hypothetical protein
LAIWFVLGGLLLKFRKINLKLIDYQATFE